MKLSDFNDYYLKKYLLLFLCALCVLFLIWSILLRPREQTVLYVAIVDDILENEKREQLLRDLQSQIQLTDKQQQIILDDSFFLNEDGLTKLEVYLSNSQIDLIIAENEVFEKLCGYGFFQDLEIVLSKEKMLEFSPDIVRAAGYLEHEEEGFEDNETGKGKVCSYGVSLPSISRWNTQININTDNSVCGFAVGSQNIENAAKFLSFIYASKN